MKKQGGILKESSLAGYPYEDSSFVLIGFPQ